MKKKFIAIILTIVLAMGVGTFFIGCGDAGTDPILDSILEQLDRLQREAAQNSRDAVLAEVELMLLERDLEMLRANLAAINTQIATLEPTLTTAVNSVNSATTARDHAQAVRNADIAHVEATAARTLLAAAVTASVTRLGFTALSPASISANANATQAQVNTQNATPQLASLGLVVGQPITTAQAEAWTVENSRRADMRANYTGDVQFVGEREALAAQDLLIARIPSNIALSTANAALTSATQHRNLIQAQLNTLRADREVVQYEIEELNTRIRGAGVENYVRMLVDHINRRFVRQGDYILVPNRFYAEQIAGRPTIPRPDSVRPTRAIAVPFNPQAVAVMCPSHLDILIALGVQDRVVTFTYFQMPDFMEYHFPRTGSHALPDLHGDGTGGSVNEPHSPNFNVLDNLENFDFVLFSSRARDRDTRFGRDYFGRLSYMAATLDLGSRSGVDTFMQDVIENVLTLGAIFGVQDRAFDSVVEFVSRQREINALATSLEATALIVQFTGVRNMALFGAASRYSFVHRELGVGQATGVGGEGAIANVTYQHGTPAGAEMLRGVDPDIIFVVDRYALNAHRQTADGAMIPTPINVLDHELFAGMYAIENNHIHYLDPGNWYLVLCGFRSLMYQFDEIYYALRQLERSRG